MSGFLGFHHFTAIDKSNAEQSSICSSYLFSRIPAYLIVIIITKERCPPPSILHATNPLWTDTFHVINEWLILKSRTISRGFFFLLALLFTIDVSDIKFWTRQNQIREEGTLIFECVGVAFSLLPWNLATIVLIQALTRCHLRYGLCTTTTDFDNKYSRFSSIIIRLGCW